MGFSLKITLPDSTCFSYTDFPVCTLNSLVLQLMCSVKMESSFAKRKLPTELPKAYLGPAAVGGLLLLKCLIVTDVPQSSSVWHFACISKNWNHLCDSLCSPNPACLFLWSWPFLRILLGDTCWFNTVSFEHHKTQSCSLGIFLLLLTLHVSLPYIVFNIRNIILAYWR